MLVEAEVVPGAGAHQVERIASTAAVQARGDSLALDLLLTQLQPPPQGSDQLCKVFFVSDHCLALSTHSLTDALEILLR